jgi:hypothetical protein
MPRLSFQIAPSTTRTKTKMTRSATSSATSSAVEALRLYHITRMPDIILLRSSRWRRRRITVRVGLRRRPTPTPPTTRTIRGMCKLRSKGSTRAFFRDEEGQNHPVRGKERSRLFVSCAVISVGDVGDMGEPTELLASTSCICVFYVRARRLVVLD